MAGDAPGFGGTGRMSAITKLSRANTQVDDTVVTGLHDPAAVAAHAGGRHGRSKGHTIQQLSLRTQVDDTGFTARQRR